MDGDQSSTGRGGRARLSLMALAVLLPVLACACNLSNWHLESIKADPYNELEGFCYEVPLSGSQRVDLNEDGAYDELDKEYAGEMLEYSLGWDNVYTEDWESLELVDHWNYGDCENPPSPEAVANTRLEFKFRQTGDSSAYPLEPGETHQNHRHYRKVRIFLTEEDFEAFRYRLAPPPAPTPKYGAWQHLTNHETGHAYGLDDPVTTKEAKKSGRYCMLLYDANRDTHNETLTPLISIMANTGHCGIEAGLLQDMSIGNVPYPTFFDRVTVDLIGKKHPDFKY